MPSYIEPKPTSYKKITYMSRLEARWAVFFDNYKPIMDCCYATHVLTLTEDEQYIDSYRPDFSFYWPHVNSRRHFLEIKPIKPNADYIKRLSRFARGIPDIIILAYGNFYKTQPVIQVYSQKGKLTKPIPMNLMFTRSTVAIKAASHYRFDL